MISKALQVVGSDWAILNLCWIVSSLRGCALIKLPDKIIDMIEALSYHYVINKANLSNYVLP